MSFDLRRARIRLKMAQEQLRLRKARLDRMVATGLETFAQTDVDEAESNVTLAWLDVALAQVDVDELASAPRTP